MTNFSSVKKFMEVFGQEVKTKAEFPPKKVADLRYNLIKEELDEFAQALKDQDLKEVADALTDILYVTYGAGHAFGIDLDKCLVFAHLADVLLEKLVEERARIARPLRGEQLPRARAVDR